METLDEGHEGAFQDFPPEIIQEILLHVLPNSIIPFALTCKRNHEISLPILNRQVTLTDATLHSFYSSKIATHDPSLVWVRDVKFTGTQMYPAPSTGMDNAAFASLFSSLPLLQALDIGAHRWQFGGWSGFQAAIQSLPTTMESLVVKVRSLNDTTAWDQRVRRPIAFLPISDLERHTGHLSILSSPRHQNLRKCYRCHPAMHSHPLESRSQLSKPHPSLNYHGS